MRSVRQALELPADLAAGVPRLELTGDSQLSMENHRVILSYGTEEICVSAGACPGFLPGSGGGTPFCWGWPCP